MGKCRSTLRRLVDIEVSPHLLLANKTTQVSSRDNSGRTPIHLQQLPLTSPSFRSWSPKAPIHEAMKNNHVTLPRNITRDSRLVRLRRNRHLNSPVSTQSKKSLRTLRTSLVKERTCLKRRYRCLCFLLTLTSPSSRKEKARTRRRLGWNLPKLGL